MLYDLTHKADNGRDEWLCQTLQLHPTTKALYIRATDENRIYRDTTAALNLCLSNVVRC